MQQRRRIAASLFTTRLLRCVQACFAFAVASAEFFRGSADSTVSIIATGAAVLIGAVTLTGSLVAFAKLQELIDEDITPTRESGFAEQHFGAWELQHWNDLPKGETTQFWTDFARQQPPNGESFADVVARVGPVFGRLSADWAGRDIVAVVHGGTVRAMLATTCSARLSGTTISSLTFGTKFTAYSAPR